MKTVKDEEKLKKMENALTPLSVTDGAKRIYTIISKITH